MRRSRTSRPGTARLLAAIAFTAAGLGGCAGGGDLESGGPFVGASGPDTGPGPGSASDAGPASGGTPGADGRSPTERSLLVGPETGLQIRQWHVGDDGARVADVLRRYADGEVLDDTERARLERNGLRLVRVRLTDVDAIHGELGPTTADVDGWHGQVYGWRSLASRPVGAAGRALRIDDVERRLAGGRLRLMMRGWTTPMEDGPYLYLELMSEFDQSRRSRLTQVLGTRSFIGERFDDAAADAFLEDGYAYVLAATPGAGAAGGESGASGGGIVTPTIGELLLRTDGLPPRRHVLVFIPKIPPEMFPSPRSPSGDAYGLAGESAP